jgi:hypothetical protein
MHTRPTQISERRACRTVRCTRATYQYQRHATVWQTLDSVESISDREDQGFRMSATAKPTYPHVINNCGRKTVVEQGYFPFVPSHSEACRNSLKITVESCKTRVIAGVMEIASNQIPPSAPLGVSPAFPF